MADGLSVRTVVERLLQRDIPDQIGETSGVQFELTGLSGDGDFDVIVSGLSLVISPPIRHRNQNARHPRVTHVNSHGDQRNPNNADRDTLMRLVHHGHVECTARSVKIKFRGKSARLCGFLTKVFSRWIISQLQISTAEFVKSWFREEPDMSSIALMALFAMNDENAVEEEELQSQCWRFRRRRRALQH